MHQIFWGCNASYDIGGNASYSTAGVGDSDMASIDRSTTTSSFRFQTDRQTDRCSGTKVPVDRLALASETLAALLRFPSAIPVHGKLWPENVHFLCSNVKHSQ